MCKGCAIGPGGLSSRVTPAATPELGPIHPTAIANVDQFRELTAKRDRIAATIAELKQICPSLNEWPKTARSLAKMGGIHMNPEWPKDRLTGLATLRNQLIEFPRGHEKAEVAWGKLGPAEKGGCTEPPSLVPPPKG